MSCIISLVQYICRTSAVLEGKEFVGSNFSVKKQNKQQLLIYHNGGHFLPRIY